MIWMLRVVHVLAVAAWFGSVVFFTVAGVLIFQGFAEVSALPGEERPLWLPLPEVFQGASPGEGFPEPIRLEQGSRAAGVAVSKIFPFYYGLQTGCAVLALLTAWVLGRQGEGQGHGWRTGLCLLALLSVVGGWWLEQEVARLRIPRNERTDEVLTARAPVSASLLEEARAARSTFGRWHGYSLIQNLVTLILVSGIIVFIPSLSVASTRLR